MMPLQSMSAWSSTPLYPKDRFFKRIHLTSPAVLASMEGRRTKVLKELGLFSLKKKIEDLLHHAEKTVATALELEQARRIQQEEALRDNIIWDNPSETNEFLAGLSNSTKDVNALKDIQYKAEEAKLIIQLADEDFINYGLFKQAYNTSIDVNNMLERYEMSKLLYGPYDKEGAFLIITARSKDHNSEVWVEKLLNMYLRWAEKHGYKGRVVHCNISKNGGICSAAVDFESEFFYGYLSGEEGAHVMIQNSNDESTVHEACAGVEVIPLFLKSEPSMFIDDVELDTSLSENDTAEFSNGSHTSVKVCHLPTGASVQYSGERSIFANKMKAINRLKGKLLAVARRQTVPDVSKIDRNKMFGAIWQETRRYVLKPKNVLDKRTDLQLSNLNSILGGNIEPFIRAHIKLRQERDSI